MLYYAIIHDLYAVYIYMIMCVCVFVCLCVCVCVCVCVWTFSKEVKLVRFLTAGGWSMTQKSPTNEDASEVIVI